MRRRGQAESELLQTRRASRPTTATSSAGSTGLAMWRSNPASMARRRSSDLASAVRATTGVFCALKL